MISIHKLIPILFLLVFSLSTVNAQKKKTKEVFMEITNLTNKKITELYVYGKWDRQWGPNLIQGDTLNYKEIFFSDI